MKHVGQASRRWRALSRLATVLLLVAACSIHADFLTSRWKAKWIASAGAPPFAYGVYHFRRTIELPQKPAAFVVHVSADNRYELFVNGHRASNGPARGDLFHWRYDTVDLAPWLHAGRNVLAAEVWNFAEVAPEAQITDRTGFLLQGDADTEQAANTGTDWKAVRNEAYSPIPVSMAELRGYYAAGPGDRVRGDLYPWGWQEPDYDDSGWKPAEAINEAAGRDSSDSPSRWMLIPRTIPAMEETPERIARVRTANGVNVPAGWPQEKAAVRIAAHTKARLLLDQDHLTTGYPELTVSGGRAAVISIGYAEALMRETEKGRWIKGNRNEIEGKSFVGYHDEFLPDGGANRTFRSLWWRTWRYIELNIETQDDPLTIDDFHGSFTGYPFQRRARFDAGSPEIERILDIGWRTARLCAHETYMDCPYYEQLQYVGDTRIQALVSLYMTGDDRLMRNAISQINDSRTPEGATFSRFPTRLQQYIPGFSLWWIGMVHDYRMYRDDPEFVRGMLPGVRAVLSFFRAHQSDRSGPLSRVPWWNYFDWTKQWEGGTPPIGSDGHSAAGDLQLLLAFHWAADLERDLGNAALAREDNDSAASLASAIQRLYWDASRRMYADSSDKREFSQQVNTLAVLAHLVDGENARDLLHRIMRDDSLVQASIYFRFYVHEAYNQAGLGDEYLSMLGPWRQMMASGLTTWAETEDPTRSDCHAWSASPNFEIFRTILGVDSAAPGFRRVSVRPFLGTLTHAEGTVPHPRGEIDVKLTREGEGVRATVTLPAQVPGEFVWKGQRRELNPGINNLTL